MLACFKHFVFSLVCFYLWHLLFCFRRGEATCRHRPRSTEESTHPPVWRGDILPRLYHRRGGPNRAWTHTHTDRHRHAYITYPQMPVRCCTSRFFLTVLAYTFSRTNTHSAHYCVITYLLWHPLPNPAPLNSHTPPPLFSPATCHCFLLPNLQLSLKPTVFVNVTFNEKVQHSLSELQEKEWGNKRGC